MTTVLAPAAESLASLQFLAPSFAKEKRVHVVPEADTSYDRGGDAVESPLFN